jgi:hypothetical protein
MAGQQLRLLLTAMCRQRDDRGLLGASYQGIAPSS